VLRLRGPSLDYWKGCARAGSRSTRRGLKGSEGAGPCSTHGWIEGMRLRGALIVWRGMRSTSLRVIAACAALRQALDLRARRSQPSVSEDSVHAQ